MAVFTKYNTLIIFYSCVIVKLPQNYSQNLLSNTPDTKPEDGDKNVCFVSIFCRFLKSGCFAHNSAQSSVSFSFMKH